MKIFNLKKRFCNFMAGGMLAFLPMFFLLSVVGTELNAQQIDRPYSEAIVNSAFETLKSEAIVLREEIKDQGGINENYLLIEYYSEVINELRSGATFDGALMVSLDVFFKSQYSNQNSNLHLAIFGTPQNHGVTGLGGNPSGGDPSGGQQSDDDSIVSYYHGSVEAEFKQLIDAINSSEGHPSTFQALFNFMNNNK